MDKIDQRIMEAKIKAREYARKKIKRVFYKRDNYAQVERMILTDSIV